LWPRPERQGRREEDECQEVAFVGGSKSRYQNALVATRSGTLLERPFGRDPSAKDGVRKTNARRLHSSAAQRAATSTPWTRHGFYKLFT
jgi:hypothetical protein